MLAGAAIAWVQLQECTKVLGEKGRTFETSSTTGALKILPRPEVEMRNVSLRLLRAYLIELGLTPCSVGRVDRAVMPRVLRDPTEEFLFGERR